LLNKKLLVAPILAIVLAFLLAGSVGFLPENSSPSQFSPQPTSVPSSVPLPTTEVGMTSESSIAVPILFVVAAIVVGIVAAFLLFSEKSLKKAMSE